MFNCPGLDKFWSQGLKNYGEEHLFYQLLTVLDWEGPSEQSQVLSGSGEQPDNIITVSDDDE